MKEIYKTIGINISVLCAKKQIKFPELATRSGVSKPTVYGILGGESINIENLVKIADALEVHPGELLYSQDEQQKIRFFSDFKEFKRFLLSQKSATK